LSDGFDDGAFIPLDAYGHRKVSPRQFGLSSEHFLDNGTQHFRHIPGLGNAAAGVMWVVACENLGDLPRSHLVEKDLYNDEARKKFPSGSGMRKSCLGASL
jgi:hypothetical protein